MQFKSSARPSPIAGTWYTSDPEVLRREIDGYIDRAKISKDEITGKIIGLVSPHAGHRYSGRTAGYAYRLVKGEEKELVVILSPFHQYHPADLITTAHRSYITPLGEVHVDKESLSQLQEGLVNEDILIQQIASDPEHSLEIQLPFLQRCLDGEFKLLPLMVRSRDPITLKKVADALSTVIAEKSYMVIASTDLSHFFPLDIAEEMDAEMLTRIKELDPEGVLAAESSGRASACGASAVAVMLWMGLNAGAKHSHILNYSTSADATGDTSSVVGYGSAAVAI